MTHFNQFVKSTSKKLAFLLIFISLSGSQLFAQLQKARSTDFGIGYLEYLPDDYNSNSNKYPVIIYLHGVGERGNDLDRLRDTGLPRLIEKRGNMCFTSNNKNECFIVISPQLPSSYGNWDTQIIDNTIEYVKKKYRVDPNRINLTGFSLGGGGTWAYSYSQENHPNKLASMAPVAGWANTKEVCYIADSHLAVWAFHGADDIKISPERTKEAINAINNCNPKPKPKMTIYPNLGHSLSLAYTMDHSEQNPNLFEWFLAQRKDEIIPEPKPSPDNKAPIAKAGNDITTTSRSVTLDGRSSYDEDGKITRYEWTKISGPIDFGGVQVGAVYTVSDMRVGDYVFQLTVTDDDGDKSSDRLSVKALNSGDTPPGDPDTGNNKAPVANAGGDITTTSQSVTLDGRSSNDSDGTIVKYEWEKLSGPINFNGIQVGAVQQVSNMRIGDYVFELTVTDNDGAKSSDKMSVKIVNSDDGNTPPDPGSGEPLVAKAGDDATIYVHSFTLDGRASYCNNGKIVKYMWEKLSGPIDFGGIHEGAVQQVTDLRLGDFVFELTIIDDKGNKASDKISITVLDTDNTPDTPNNKAPVAKAGSDITMYTPNRSITLDGRGSYDSDGNIVKYTWEKISGPLNYSGIHEGAVQQVNDLRTADYEFELTVTDDDGAKSTDRITVRVINSSNSRTITASQLDKGNTEATEDDSTLSESLDSNASHISAYPNPFQNELNLALGNESEGKVDITILDLAGRTVYQISRELTVGEASMNLDLSGLSLKSGVWLIKVKKQDGTIKILRLIKQ